MDELQTYLKRRKSEKGFLFVPYHAFSDPDPETSLEVVRTLFKNGADAIEIGLPFSDPVADGPVLQRTFRRILANDYSMLRFLAFLAAVHAEFPDRQLLVMGYVNLFLQYGLKKLFREFYERGVRGVIIPDVPREEKQYLIEDHKLGEYRDKIAWIDFVTPTTSQKRQSEISASANGFIYMVSYKGVTGRTDFNLNPLKPIFRNLKKQTSVPLLVGFGVRTHSDVRQTIRLADGFVIASRLHEIIEDNLKTPGRIPDLIAREVQGLLRPS